MRQALIRVDEARLVNVNGSAELLDRAVNAAAGNTRTRVSGPDRGQNRRLRRVRGKRCKGGSTTSRYDRGKSFVFLNNRHYNPSTGVFVSVDPLVTMTGQPYVYGAANPVTYSDPEGLCPATGPDAAEACRAWAQTESTGVGPQFWDDVVVPLASGTLPTAQPEKFGPIEEWTDDQLEWMTLAYNSWHNAAGVEPHGDTNTRFQMYRDYLDMPDHHLGQEFMPGLPQLWGLDLALALWPSAGRASGQFPAISGASSVPLAEQAFLSSRVGGASRLFGDSRTLGGQAGRSGLLNSPGRFVKVGWSKDVKAEFVQFRVGIGKGPNPNTAARHPFTGARIPFHRSDNLVDLIRQWFQ